MGEPAPFVSPSARGAVVSVLVQPHAAKDAIVGVHGNALKVRVQAPPVEDRANKAVERLIAAALGVPRARVSVISGRSARHKRISVAGADVELVTSALLHVLSCRTHEPR